MDTFTFPPPSKSSLPAPVISVETSVEKDAQNEREVRLINARKKLKNYRLKQAAAANSRDASSATGSFGLSANASNPTPNGTLSTSAAATPGISRHKHTRTHSRNQSRSSLASILVSSEQVNIIDEVLAHQRRLSVTKPAYHHSRRDSLSRPITTPSLDSNATNANRLSATFTSASVNTFEGSSTLPGFNSNRISLPPPVAGTTPTLVSTPWAGHDPSQPHQRTNSSSFVPHQHGHVRRESKHMRKNSVSTRRESIEIMGGLGIIGVPSAPTGLCPVSQSENTGGARSINRGSWSGFPNPALSRVDPYSPPCTASSNTFSSLGTRLSASGLGPGAAHLSNMDLPVLVQSKKHASADVSPGTIPVEVVDLDGVESLTEPTPGSMSVELARLAALSALEGKPSPQGRNAELEDSEKPVPPSSEGPGISSPSNASDSTSMQSMTPKVFTPAYHDIHGTFQPQPFACADLQSDTGINPEPSPNLNFGTSLSSRSERRMSWINGSVNNAGPNAPPVIGASGINGLSWSGAGGLGLVRDLSRVEEEEENEDEDDTMRISSVMSQPRAMETVAEEEEEDEEDSTSNPMPKPTPPKRRPHSLIFNSRSTSTTPTGSPSFGFGSRTLPPSSNVRPLRALSLSLSQQPSAQVPTPPAKLKPLALTSPKLSDTGSTFAIPTQGSSGATPLSHFSAAHCGSSSASASPSPSTSMLKFERPFPASSAVVGSQYNHYSAGSNSTNRSSLSGSIGSVPFASKPCVTRSRRSISYSKSPSPEPAKPPLTINTAPAKVGRFQALAQQSPTHSTSSAASKSSSQLDREQAHDGWKQSLVQSLQQKHDASFSRRENESVSSFQADGFGDLVMDGLDMEQLVQNDFSALEPEDEHGARQSILKAELLKARAETGRVRTESESARVDLENRISKLQRQLEEMRKCANAEDSSSLLAVAEVSQSTDETSALVKRLEVEVDELKKLVDELESAKSELEEDVTGFKLRLKFLEGQMIQEKAKTAEYERDLKEKDRMIGELLRKRKNRSKTKVTTNSSSDTPTSSGDSGVSGSGLSGATEEEMEDESELKAAQVKLINEMRDQIFALASALERERSEHVATKDALEAAAMQIEVNELDAEGPAMSTLFSDEETSPVDSIPFESVVKQVRDSQIQSSSGDSKGSSTDAELPDQLSPIVATVKAINCIREDSVDSTDSAPSEPLPKTPIVERPQLHHRSESFIRHWSFPKGPVTHSARSSEEDHCFFFRPNSIDITLPPVEPAKEVLETPPFLFSYLHHEEPEQTEQVKPAAYQKFSVSAMTHVPTAPHVLAMRKKDSFRSPLSSVSSIQSHYGARQDSIGSSTGKPGGASMTSRLSLQNLSSWVGNYVGGGNGMKMKEDLRLLQLQRLERRLKDRGVGNLDFRRCFEDSEDDDDDQMKEEGVDSHSSSSSISTNLRQKFFVI